MKRNHIKHIGRVYFVILLLSAIMMTAAGCNSGKTRSDGSPAGNNAETDGSDNGAGEAAVVKTDAMNAAEVMSSVSGEEVAIQLNGAAAECSDGGVSVQDGTVTISRAGTYRITGTLDNGRIVVAAGKNDNVVLILDNAEIANGTEAAVYVENADNTVIYLAEGTKNRVVSGNAVEITEDTQAKETASGGAIYAKDDLAIDGEGQLIVGGYINNGIQCSNDLTILGGGIQVTAVNNAIKGKDSITILGGTVDITAGNDGMKSDNDTEEGLGNIVIEDGVLTINANGDGISACAALTVYGGTITVLDSYEGLEAKQIVIEDGILDISAADDGINANGGTSVGRGFGGGVNTSSFSGEEDMPNLIIRGGSIHVNAGGDGLDSNGNLIVEGGTTIVDGPTDNGNGALDYGMEAGGKCTISGGTLLALGSCGMAESFDSASAQCSVRYYCGLAYAAGDLISIEDEGGSVIYSYEAKKGGSCIIFSSPELKQGENYTFNAGSETMQVALSSVCTDAGSSSGMGGFGGFGGRGGKTGGQRPDGRNQTMPEQRGGGYINGL